MQAYRIIFLRRSCAPEGPVRAVTKLGWILPRGPDWARQMDFP